MRLTRLLAVVMVLFAGCVGGDSMEDPNPMGIGPGTTSSGSSGAGQPDPSSQSGGEPVPRVEINGILQLDGCVWFQAPSEYFAGTNPAPTPPGWGPEDKPFSVNLLQLLQCASVSLDELDRPASLLIEDTDSGARPEACRDPDRNVSYLTNLFIDDEALAEILATRYHVPVKLATFSVTTDETGTTWTWSHGGLESTMSYPVPNVEDREMIFTDARIIWATPNGTNTFEARYDVIGPNAGRVGQGTLAPFHYMGVEGRFAGVAGAGPELSMFANIRARGPLCEELDS